MICMIKVLMDINASNLIGKSYFSTKLNGIQWDTKLHLKRVILIIY